jgi:predicted nucleic acid-binding protein
VTKLIVDTGPLVALIDRRDQFHAWARDFFETVNAPIFSCEPVLTEACFILRQVGGHDAILALSARRILLTEVRVIGEVGAVRGLMQRFADVPMSLADACLVRMTELEADSAVVTIDSDFTVYRRHRRQVIPTIMPV